MVMHVPQSRRRSQRLKEANSKVVAVQPETAQGAAMEELTVEAPQEAEVTLQQGQGEPEDTPAQLDNEPDVEEVQVHAEEVEKDQAGTRYRHSGEMSDAAANAEAHQVVHHRSSATSKQTGENQYARGRATL